MPVIFRSYCKINFISFFVIKVSAELLNIDIETHKLNYLNLVLKNVLFVKIYLEKQLSEK